MTDKNNMVSWADIESAAAKMFKVWTDGGELEWAKECWQHFSEAGLTGNVGVLETTKTYLRLVALARIYEEFCGRAWDENPDTPLDYLAENLEMDPVALGILAASDNEADFRDSSDYYELREAAMRSVTNAMRREIFECLAHAYGNEIKLYSRMSKTNHSADVEDDGDEFEVTGSNSIAYEYVTNGFRN